MRRAVAVAVAVALAGCGGGGDESGGATYDGELLAGCIANRSGSPPADPVTALRLSAALRQAAGPRQQGTGSILPRRHAFAVFAGYARTFVPPGSGAAEFVPAAFIVFGDEDAAREHAGDADARRGNVLTVYDGRPPKEETALVDICLGKAQGD